MDLFANSCMRASSSSLQFNYEHIRHIFCSKNAQWTYKRLIHQRKKGHKSSDYTTYMIKMPWRARNLNQIRV